ncbi:MAG: orotidine-5'-phosphate decarboxylase [Clostridia bacterium]|nr:orotidine-5'-phosphate decarboxylase [Clostridia bacterium]
MSHHVIIACDFASREETLRFLAPFEAAQGEKPWLKIGMELYYAEGPQMVRELKEKGYHIFLDLKLHDIPNTVKKDMRVLKDLDVDMVNLHASGGIAMMRAAVEGLTREDGTRPILIAVTQLTSTSQEVMEQELLIEKPLDKVVMHYAKNAREAGLDGVVCSPLEAGKVHEVCGADFVTVTPGVRFAGGEVGDQVRVTTPQRAGEIGSDYLVMGRPITGSEDPVEAYARATREFRQGAEKR